MSNNYHDVQHIEGSRILYLSNKCQQDETVKFVNGIATIMKKGRFQLLIEKIRGSYGNTKG